MFLRIVPKFSKDKLGRDVTLRVVPKSDNTFDVDQLGREWCDVPKSGSSLLDKDTLEWCDVPKSGSSLLDKDTPEWCIVPDQDTPNREWHEDGKLSTRTNGMDNQRVEAGTNQLYSQPIDSF